jgi:putative membrane protein
LSGSASQGRGLRGAVLAATLAVLLWSGIGPHDRLTWFLEVAPVLIGLAAVLATYGRFPLTNLLYLLLLVHAIILMVGGHYTYANVPLGFWLQEALDLGRNHYDRLGHVAQGFVPAILAREILIRCSPVKRGPWLWLFITTICLAFSAFYEMIEWWVALFSGEDATAFLGTQGDPWDTQWDMFLALCGALAAQALLGRSHDRALKDRGYV